MTDKSAEAEYLGGANQDVEDIDLLPNPDLGREMGKCLWNKAEGTDKHKCVVKSVSHREHLMGVNKPDVVIRAYRGDLG